MYQRYCRVTALTDGTKQSSKRKYVRERGWKKDMKQRILGKPDGVSVLIFW